MQRTSKQRTRLLCAAILAVILYGYSQARTHEVIHGGSYVIRVAGGSSHYLALYVHTRPILSATEWLESREVAQVHLGPARPNGTTRLEGPSTGSDVRSALWNGWTAACLILSDASTHQAPQKCSTTLWGLGSRPLAMIPENLSGRSAGLADGLAYVEYLGAGDLSGGRIVAATGVLDGSGYVGEIAGARFKTEAAIRAGANILFVPAENLVEARIAAELYRDKAPLQIISVRNLREAVIVLCAQPAVRDEACALLDTSGD